jgi:hypothetical protein
MTDPRESPAENLRRELSEILSRLRESAANREPITDEERDLILALCTTLKRFGHSPADLLARMATSEAKLRELLRLEDTENRIPTVDELIPFLSGDKRTLCPWPGHDFFHAPSVLQQLAFLRQQNDPWIGKGNSVARPLPESPEDVFWSKDATNELWRIRLLVGANKATEARLARRKDLDRLAEALRFNRGRSGRRPTRTVAFLVEKYLYVFYRAAHGLLRKGQRESPKRLRDERSIAEFLESSSYPRFMIARLAQELSEHRQRRRGSGIRLTLNDRAALMVAELEGRRGEYGLPEPLGTDELLEEDTSQPPSAAMRRPPPGPFASREAEMRYERMLRRTLGRAHGRVRQAKAIWNSGFVAPKPNKK